MRRSGTAASGRTMVWCGATQTEPAGSFMAPARIVVGNPGDDEWDPDRVDPFSARLSTDVPVAYFYLVMRTKLFLASSSQSGEDRKEFEILINRKNKDWVDRGAFLELVVWGRLSGCALEDAAARRIQQSDQGVRCLCNVFLYQGREIYRRRVRDGLRAVQGHQQAFNLHLLQKC